MSIQKIDETFESYVNNNEIAGASLLIRRNGETVYKNKWGFSNLEDGTPLEYDTLFRIMSMTKCITAVSVMICVERGLLALDDPLSKYIPEFKNMPVSDDPRYVFDEKKLKLLPFKLIGFSMKKVKRRPAARELTIRDLLSHSSGLQQGLAGLLAMIKEKTQYETLKDYVLHYADYVLDFDPGTGTGYSPLAGFDILGYVISLVSEKSLEEFMCDEIFVPLGMKDTTFFPNPEQKSRLCRVYKRKNNALSDVTGTKDDMAGTTKQKIIRYEQGAGGLFSTLEDYDRFGQMLFNGGELDGARILTNGSVELLHTEAPLAHLEPDPGCVWGLGMKIRQDPEKGNLPVSAGTYGWSGAFGSHFYISPEEGVQVTFMMNRSDIGGAGSYIIKKLEELVSEAFQ